MADPRQAVSAPAWRGSRIILRASLRSVLTNLRRFEEGFLPRALSIYLGVLKSSEVASDAPAVPAVAVELESGAALPVNLRPDWRPLFPQGYMFGIQTVEKRYGFIDDGIGRWFELELPVEMNDERWVYRIRLLARDIGQWTSYH